MFDPISYILAKKARRLSNLFIDTDKDWQGYRIVNLGEPVDPGDVPTKDYVDRIFANFNVIFYLTDEQDADTGYKVMQIEPIASASQEYVEVSNSSGAGDYLIGTWIAKEGQLFSKLMAGVYTLLVQARRVSGNSGVRLYFELYDRLSDGTENLILTSNSSDLIKARGLAIATGLLEQDTEMQGRLVLKVYIHFNSNASTTVRVYYLGDTVSRLVVPTTKEVLDKMYVSTDEKRKIFVSSTEPVAENVGDIWIQI